MKYTGIGGIKVKLKYINLTFTVYVNIHYL